MRPDEDGAIGQIFGPVYVPGTVIPALSWTARYPDQHDPVPVQYTGATWVPVLPPTPYGWQAAYLDQHPPVPVQYTGATWTPQLPATPQGWAAYAPEALPLQQPLHTVVSWVFEPPAAAVPTQWAAYYPDWIAAPSFVLRSGADYQAAEADVTYAPAGAPMAVQRWPEDVRHTFPASFFVEAPAAAVVPDLWAVVAPSWLPSLPTVQPPAWTGPAAPPVAPDGWAAYAPDALEWRQPTQPTASAYPFPTPADVVVVWDWFPSYPVQFPPLPVLTGVSVTGGLIPILPTLAAWSPDYPVQLEARAATQPLASTYPFPTPVAAVVTWGWQASYPDQLEARLVSPSDPAVFSAILQPSGAGLLFRRTLQYRTGGRTEQMK